MTSADAMERKSRAGRYALRFAAIYAVFGMVWIFATDYLASRLTSDERTFLYAETTKGVLYVVVTALLVYWLARRTVHYAELRATENLLTKVLSSLGEAVVVVDPPSRTIRECNPAAEKMFGYTRDQLVGQDTSMLHVDESSYRRFADEGEKVLARGEPYHADYQMKRADGVIIDTEITVAALNEDIGWRDGVVSIARDVTESKRTHAALVERMKELETLYKAMQCLVRVDVPLNERLSELVEFLPAGWLYPDITEARIVFGGAAFATPGFRETEWMQSSPIHFQGRVEGTIDISLLEERPQRDEGPFLREERALLDGLARVITEAVERRRLEQQFYHAQRVESVGKIAGEIAHDFNNTLTAILGHTQMAIESVEPSSPAHEDLELVYEAAEQSANLVRQLLAYSRQEEFNPALVDLNDAIERALPMLKSALPETIGLVWEPSEQPLSVSVDTQQTKQVLLNLVLNARDAIEDEGTITLRTRPAALPEPRPTVHDHDGDVPTGEYAAILVSDTGRGMDKQTKARIFQPFFSTKPKDVGTGLGLSSAYGMIKQNGGYIDVESEPGKGTTFKIFLPLRTDAS